MKEKSKTRKAAFPCSVTPELKSGLENSVNDLGYCLRESERKWQTFSEKEKKEKMRFMRTVIATLKHEIFNPLQAIACANKVIANKYGYEASSKLITENIIRLKDVIDKLDALTEVREDGYPGNATVIDLSE